MRTMSGAMISSADNMTGGLLWGVDATLEAGVSKLRESMVAGEYLSGGQGEIVLGEDLVDLLELELGDRIVVTLSQVNGGELSQALFRLSGVFKFGMREIDNSMAFINIAQSREILGMGAGAAHEVAFNFHNAADAANTEHPVITVSYTHLTLPTIYSV